MKSVGVVGSQPQDGHRSCRKADGVDRIMSQFAQNAVLQVPVGLWVDGLIGRSVAQEIHPDHCSAGVSEQIDPAVIPPCGLEGGSEPVDEQNIGTGHPTNLPVT
jgi:hypothetical protein